MIKLKIYNNSKCDPNMFSESFTFTFTDKGKIFIDSTEHKDLLHVNTDMLYEMINEYFKKI